MLSMLAIVAFVFSSCSDNDSDDDSDVDSGTEGSYTYNGEKIGLETAVLVYSTDPQENTDQNTYYRHNLTLWSSGLTVDDNGDATGKGDVLDFAILSSSETLEAGSYTINLEDEDAPLLITWAVIYRGVSNGNFEGMIMLESGKLVIAKSADTYTMTLTATTSTDKSVTASYKGKLKSFEEEE